MSVTEELTAATQVLPGEPETCEAINEIFGLRLPCTQPVAGRYLRICPHRHFKEGGLCAGHVRAVQAGVCRDCADLDGPLAHDCPISLTPTSDVGTAS